MTEKFWIEFLQLYKEQPCLWNKSSKDYKNQTMRTLAYSILLEKLWEVDATAKISTVEKKLLNFHRCYRVNRKKQIESKTALCPAKPWFFKRYLDFYYQQDLVTTTESNTESIKESNKDSNTESNNESSSESSSESDDDIILPNTEGSTSFFSDTVKRIAKAQLARIRGKGKEKQPMIAPFVQNNSSSIINVQSVGKKIKGKAETLPVAESDPIGTDDIYEKDQNVTEDDQMIEDEQAIEEDQTIEGEQPVNPIFLGFSDEPIAQSDPLVLKNEEPMGNDELIDQDSINDEESEEQAFAISDDDESPNSVLCRILENTASGFEGRMHYENAFFNNVKRATPENVVDNSIQVQDKEIVTGDTVAVADIEDAGLKFCAYVANKMESFDQEQKCISQKLIGDIIFLASTKQLSLNSRVSRKS